jgi:hypothetical protein
MIRRSLMIGMLASGLSVEAHANNLANPPRLTATEFAAVASELRRSPEIFRKNVEECSNKSFPKIPAPFEGNTELSAMIKRQCFRLMKNISSGIISYEGYNLIWNSDVRGIVEYLD